MPRVPFSGNHLIVSHQNTEGTPTPPPEPGWVCLSPFHFPTGNVGPIEIAATPARRAGEGVPQLQITLNVLKGVTLTGIGLHGTPGEGKYLLIVMLDAYRSNDYAYLPATLDEEGILLHQAFDASMLNAAGAVAIPFDEPLVLPAEHYEFMLFDAFHYGLADAPLSGTSIFTREVEQENFYGAFALNERLTDPAPHPLVTVDYTSYYYYPNPGDDNTALYGPDHYEDRYLPHRIWQGFLCVDDYVPDPSYQISYMDSFDNEDTSATPGNLSLDLEGGWIMEWAGRYVPSILKNLSFFASTHLTPNLWGEFLLCEITQVPWSGLQENRPLARVALEAAPDSTLVERLLQNMPAQGFRSNMKVDRPRLGFILIPWLAHGTTPGVWGGSVELQYKPNGRQFQIERDMSDSVWYSQQHVLGGLARGGDFPNRSFMRLENDVVETENTPVQVSGPASEQAPLHYQPSGFSIIRIEHDVWADATLEHIDIRTKRTGPSLGGLTLSRPMPFYNSDSPNIFETIVVTVPASGITADGYTRFTIPEDLKGDFRLEKGKTHRLYLTDSCISWAQNHPEGDGGPESYLLYEVTADPLSSTVTLPLWPAQTGFRDITPDFAPYPVIGNTRATMKTFTPGSNEEIDAFGLNPGTIPYGSHLKRSEENLTADVRLGLHPNTTMDTSMFHIGNSQQAGKTALVMSDAPVGGLRCAFTLHDQPELCLHYLEILAQSTSGTGSSIGVKVFLEDGTVDPAGYDFASATPLFSIEQSITANTTKSHLTSESHHFNVDGGPISGHTIPAGTHTLLVLVHRTGAPASWPFTTAYIQQMTTLQNFGCSLPGVTAHPLVGHPQENSFPAIKLYLDTPPRNPILDL